MIQFYVDELSRMMTENAMNGGRFFEVFQSRADAQPARVPRLPVDGSVYRWIRCPLCLAQHFSRNRYHAYGLCPDCRARVRSGACRYYFHTIHRHLHATQLQKVHDELIEWCLRPEYVTKTGWLETLDRFGGA